MIYIVWHFAFFYFIIAIVLAFSSLLNHVLYLMSFKETYKYSSTYSFSKIRILERLLIKILTHSSVKFYNFIKTSPVSQKYHKHMEKFFVFEFPKCHICHPANLSSVFPFFCPQPFPASGSFPVSCLFVSGGHSIGASDSASVLPINFQG